MPISCPHDGTEHSDRARFCMECGRPLRPDAASAPAEGVAAPVPGRTNGHSLVAEWEYSEVVVPLDAVGQTMHAAVQLAMEHYHQALAYQLARAAADGWEPNGPTDWDYLMSHGRVKSRIPPTMLPPFEFRSATLMFKRRAQA